MALSKRICRLTAGVAVCRSPPLRRNVETCTGNLRHAAARVELHEGYIETAPEGPFDAATCLLILQFIPHAEPWVAVIREGVDPRPALARTFNSARLVPGLNFFGRLTVTKANRCNLCKSGFGPDPGP